MKALRLTGWGKPAELCDVAVPTVAPGQVLIQILGSGACHSDLHLMEWPAGQLPWQIPFTLGHENAGRVVDTGEGVTSVKRGDAVLVYGPWGCGACRACRLGRENYCERAGTIPAGGGGLGVDGGMANFMLVPSARFLVPLGDLDPVRAAPLADAALTPYHAIAKARDRMYPGAAVVVIGAGGLGQMAIQLLKCTTGVRVIALDIDEQKLAIARESGADAAVHSTTSSPASLQAAIGAAGADVVLDMVGSEATLALGARCLRAEGRMVVIGLAGGTLPFSFFALPYGAELTTSYWGTLPELIELVALAKTGKLHVNVETFPLHEAPEVYARLKRGEIRGRAVIVPDQG